MDELDLVTRTADYVQSKFYGESSGHDWWHIHRVYETSMQIRIGEAHVSIKEDVVALAALIHDLADDVVDKSFFGHEPD